MSFLHCKEYLFLVVSLSHTRKFIFIETAVDKRKKAPREAETNGRSVRVDT